MRPVPQSCIDFVRSVEGCKLVGYLDTRGTVTDGFGNLHGAQLGVAITMDRAVADLTSNLAIAASRLAGVVKQSVIDGLAEHQYGALVSFVFNLGAGADWTIWKVLNAGQLDEVPVQMMRFDKETLPDGTVQVVPGLINRRMAEVAFWKTADVASSAAIMQAAPVQPPPSSYTQSIQTPPQPLDAKPIIQSKSFLASAASAVTVGGVAIKSVSDAITPYTDASPVIGKAVALLATAAAAFAILTLFFVWLKKRQGQQ